MHAENNSVLPSYFMGLVVILIAVFTEPLLALIGILIIWTASMAAIIEGYRMSVQKMATLEPVEKEPTPERKTGVSA